MAKRNAFAVGERTTLWDPYHHHRPLTLDTLPGDPVNMTTRTLKASAPSIMPAQPGAQYQQAMPKRIPAKTAKSAKPAEIAQKPPATPANDNQHVTTQTDTTTPEKNKGGRPLAITEDQEKRLITLLRAGNRIAVACSIAGVPQSTISHMILRYERGEPTNSRGNEVAARLKRAQDYAEQVSVRKVRKAGKGWQAHAWYLERTRPQQYALVQRIDMKTVIKDLRNLPDKELAALAGKAASATGLVDMAQDSEGGYSAEAQ